MVDVKVDKMLAFTPLPSPSAKTKIVVSPSRAICTMSPQSCSPNLLCFYSLRQHTNHSSSVSVSFSFVRAISFSVQWFRPAEMQFPATRICFSTTLSVISTAALHWLSFEIFICSSALMSFIKTMIMRYSFRKQWFLPHISDIQPNIFAYHTHFFSLLKAST